MTKQTDKDTQLKKTLDVLMLNYSTPAEEEDVGSKILFYGGFELVNERKFRKFSDNYENINVILDTYNSPTIWTRPDVDVIMTRTIKPENKSTKMMKAIGVLPRSIEIPYSECDIYVSNKLLNENIAKVSFELDKIVFKYEGNPEYGNLRKSLWEQNLCDYGGKSDGGFFWQLYYETKTGDTISIDFKGGMSWISRLFYPYSVSGKMIETGIRERDFKTYSLDKALVEFQARISEISHDIEMCSKSFNEKYGNCH